MKKNIILILMVCFLYSCAENKTVKNSLRKANLKGSVSSVETLIYSTDNKFGEITKDRLMWKETSKYDERGNEIESFAYDAIGTLRWKIEFDIDGKKIKKSEYANDGSWKMKYTYKYDKQGNETEINAYDSEGNLRWKETFTYNDDGNIVEWNQGGGLKYNYKYDERGNHIEWICTNIEGKLKWKAKYKYDDKGNKTELNARDPNGELILKDTHMYEFDEKGNWIRRISFLDKSRTEITERVIEYY